MKPLSLSLSLSHLFPAPVFSRTVNKRAAVIADVVRVETFEGVDVGPKKLCLLFVLVAKAEDAAVRWEVQVHSGQAAVGRVGAKLLVKLIRRRSKRKTMNSSSY